MGTDTQDMRVLGAPLSFFWFHSYLPITVVEEAISRIKEDKVDINTIKDIIQSMEDKI